MFCLETRAIDGDKPCLSCRFPSVLSSDGARFSFSWKYQLLAGRQAVEIGKSSSAPATQRAESSYPQICSCPLQGKWQIKPTLSYVLARTVVF